MLERPLVRAEFLEYRVVRIDLHTHSTASDGTDSPAELVRNAAAAGLDVVALTDHDTTRGHAEAIEALPEGLTLVTGAELSCRVDGIGLHMLAYLFEEFVRSHGLRLVVSAVAELESGNLDAACAAGTRAVEVAGRISSARTTEYVRDLLHRLEPYGDEPRVMELRERARPLLVTPA